MTRSRFQVRMAWVAPIVALTVLTAFELRSSDSDGCVEIYATLEEEEAFELTFDDTTWLDMETDGDHVYRLEVNGSEATGLELWRVIFDSSVYCSIPLDLIESTQTSNGNAVFEWTADSVGDTGVRMSPPEGGISANAALTFSKLATPLDWGGTVLVIPAVAHAPGDRGTFFQTDVTIFNAGLDEVNLELELLLSSGRLRHKSTFSVAPQHILALEDVMLSVFGLDNTTGALLIRVDSSYLQPLIAVSRTYTESTGGTYGQFIPAELWNNAAGQDGIYWAGSRSLLHLAKSENFRSNVGMVEVIGLDEQIELEMRDASGATLGNGTVPLGAFTHHQVNDIFDFLAAPPADAASITVDLVGHARYFTYASVVDNRSGDSIFVPGLRGDNGRWASIPAAASTPGAHGTFWKTDLRVLPSAAPATLEVVFLPSDGSAQTTGSVELATTGVSAIDDVVGLLGASGSGALALHCDVDISVTSRTYTESAVGTFGQFIPARGIHRTDKVLGDAYNFEATAIGVQGAGGYRSNIGIFNPFNDREMDVVVRLVSSTGRLLGSTLRHLEPWRHLQINDIFRALHAAPQSSCRVDLEVVNDSAFVEAYASVIDNRSGDPIFIPASLPFRGVLQPTLELSNLDNALLVDQLVEAVGIQQLPDGTFTALVTGNASVGGADQPPHVLCLYKDMDGALRSQAVPLGGGLTGIAGGQPLWCVITDWITADDNSGAVSVSLFDGEQPAMELILDARDNAVLLDRRLESVVAFYPPAETSRVVVSGDLGRPELAPRVVAMHRDSDNGVVRVRTLGDGEIIERIDTRDRLVVAVLDWINRDDNSGAASFEQACTTRTGACNSVVAGTITAGDCSESPQGAQSQGERVEFSGTVGQALTVQATWQGLGLPRLHLVDPVGRPVAESDPTGDLFLNRTLQATGVYVLWITSETNDRSEGRYEAELLCEDP